MDLNRPWIDYDYVSFDLETSGAYPIGDEIVEVGMVRWRKGQEIAQLQTLIKPRKLMTDFIIGIHGITNEMVANEPPIDKKIKEIKDFFSGAVGIAHHAPFDLGFLSYDFERHFIPLPLEPVICSSLLSRAVIPESPNHKLQTLIPFLGLPQGTAHRALDDCRACLQVALICFQKMGETATLAEIQKKMGKQLEWSQFSMDSLKRKSNVLSIIEAIKDSKNIDIIYNSGTHKGVPRQVRPIGLVRNPDGDYLYAFCFIDKIEKRFYLEKIKEAQIIYSS